MLRLAPPALRPDLFRILIFILLHRVAAGVPLVRLSSRGHLLSGMSVMTVLAGMSCMRGLCGMQNICMTPYWWRAGIITCEKST